MREGTIIGSVIVAIGLVVAAIAFVLVGALLDSAESAAELKVDKLEGEVERLERELVRTREESRQLAADVRRMQDDFAAMRSASSIAVAPRTATVSVVDDLPLGDHDQDVTQTGVIADARFNRGITQPNNRAMLSVLGRPRDDLSQECQSPTNPRLRALMETRQVGPIRVTMIRPALDSLERVMARLAREEPEIHAAIGTAGALCARFVRGSNRSISNHSWGTAIDLNLEGQLDGFGDGSTQFGLLPIAEAFNDEGWYWGATYRREDSMHFEVGVETLQAWANSGKLQ